MLFRSNYPGFPGGISGMELAKKMTEQVEKMGISIKCSKIDSLKKEKSFFNIFSSEGEIKARSVIIATGTTPKKLGISNEEKLIGRGISYCATCDGPLFRDKKVAVIGGGNSALEEAIFLSQLVQKLYLIHRRDEFRGDILLQKRIKANNKIEILFSYTPEAVMGDEKVRALRVKNKKTGQEKQIEVDGIFIFVGLEPKSELVDKLVKVDEGKFIITDENMQTSEAGIFAAGDVRSKKSRQIVFASSEGALAALSACRYLDEDNK